MPTAAYVGFVRAVMLGRDGLHREVLLDIVERAGGEDAASYLTTATCRSKPPVMVRSLAHLRRLVARSPFDAEPHDVPRARLVTMVRDLVDDDFEVPIVSRRATTTCSVSTAARSSRSRSIRLAGSRIRVD